MLDIANQSPLTGGDAVHSARVILGIDMNVDDQYKSAQIINTVNSKIISSINVYPNPANDKLNIEFDDSMEGQTTIEIFDLEGRLIYNSHVNADQKNQIINISSVNAGIFSLRITTKNKTFNQKLVIIK